MYTSNVFYFVFSRYSHADSISWRWGVHCNRSSKPDPEEGDIRVWGILQRCVEQQESVQRLLDLLRYTELKSSSRLERFFVGFNHKGYFHDDLNVKQVNFPDIIVLAICADWYWCYLLMLKTGSCEECARKQDEMDSDEEAENPSKQTRKVSYHYNRWFALEIYCLCCLLGFKWRR